MYLLPRIIGSLHWARIGPRDRLIRFFCNPDEVKSTEYETNFFGMRYRGNLNSYIDWNVYFYGAYEPENLLLLQKLLIGKRKPVFIDIGANVGVHSLYLSRFCEQVHSFEPNGLVREKLQEKIEINSVKNILVHGFGVGARNESLPFFAPKGCNQGTGSFVSGYSDNNEDSGNLLGMV